MSILDSLSSGGGDIPIFKFTNPGDGIERGVVVEPPQLLPQKVFGSDEPKLDNAWQPGNAGAARVGDGATAGRRPRR